MAKAVIFICDGVIETAYASDPNLDVTIVDYDGDLDDSEALKALYKTYEEERGMHQCSPRIIHPGKE